MRNVSDHKVSRYSKIEYLRIESVLVGLMQMVVGDGAHRVQLQVFDVEVDHQLLLNKSTHRLVVFSQR